MSRKTRKLIWSAPLVAVLAVAGALAMFVMLAPENAQADGAPGPVTGLNPSDIGRHHVELSWTAPTTVNSDGDTVTDETVTGYRIDMSSDAFVWMLHKDDTGSADTTYKVEDLDPGTPYHFRVFALNGDHTGPYSIRPLNLRVVTDPAVAPDVVTGLTATRGLEKKITLTWQQPAYDGGADVARYCILVRGVQDNATFGAVAACTADATATNAAALADAIEALNADPQTPVTTIIVEAEDVEATDEDVEAGDATAGSATWTLSESDNGTPNVDADDVELGDGITAMFQVVAVNTPGQSIASNIAEGNTAEMTPDPAPTAPAAPANLKLVGVGPASGDNNNVYLYWNTPTDLAAGLAASPATVTVQVQRQYHRDTIGWRPISTTGGWVDVEHDTDADATNGLVDAGTDDNYSQHHDGGSAADIDSADTDSVRYRVRFVENQLTSEWVYSHRGGGGLSLPFPQAIDHDYDSSSTTVSVDTVGTVASLPVIAGDDNADVDGDQGLRSVNDMAHFHRIDLAWDRNNYCRVADGDDTDSDCDTTGQPSTYAVDVIGGAAVPVANDGADADWDFLTDTISASRTTYRHNSSSRDDATKLVSDETRYYRVFPWAAGRYGYPMVVTANTKLATVPGRIPTNGLRVTANGDEKLDLDWDAASGDGGSPVTGYIIQVSQDRDNNTALGAGIGWCDVAHQAVSDPPVATDRMYTYDGDVRSTGVNGCADTNEVAPLTEDGEALAAGYGRWFRVIPLNKKSETNLNADAATAWEIDADSNNAIPAFGRTGAADPLAPGSAPGAPIGLVAETALNVHSELTTDKGVLLTWDVPADAGTLQGGIDAVITDYVIQVSVDGGAWSTLEDGETAEVTDWTHSDPLPTATENRAYQVAAVNIVGQGSWSNTAYYSTTSMVAPDHTHPPATADLTAPTMVMGSPTAARELTLTWEGAENAEYYILVAVDVAAFETGAANYYETASVSDGAARTGMVSNLNSGTVYLGIVFSARGTGADMELMHGVAMSPTTVQ